MDSRRHHIHMRGFVCVWVVLALLSLLAACGRSATGDSPTPSAAPAPTAASRARNLDATATALTANGPPRTPGFFPVNPPPAIASAAANPLLPASPTQPGLPREGTPRSLPGAIGQLVPVGGHRLWLACQGSGAPTVVMDAGVNSGSQIWSFVWSAVAASTRVCVYDRAGLGHSDPIPRPRTSREVVDDLHDLLENAAIPGPYVLVAHSFGGLNVRLYASQYPNDVEGLVLVDVVHEDRFAATAKILTPQQEAAFEQGRQANPEGLDYYESSRLVREIGTRLPNIPVIVIARGRPESWPSGYPVAALERSWRELATDLASRAPQGTLLIAERSDHNIPGQQPAIVIEATRLVVVRVRDR